MEKIPFETTLGTQDEVAFAPWYATLSVPRPVMRECSLTMNDGTIIEAHYQTKASLRLAIEELMRLLETEG